MVTWIKWNKWRSILKLNYSEKLVPQWESKPWPSTILEFWKVNGSTPIGELVFWVIPLENASSLISYSISLILSVEICLIDGWWGVHPMYILSPPNPMLFTVCKDTVEQTHRSSPSIKIRYNYVIIDLSDNLLQRKENTLLVQERLYWSALGKAHCLEVCIYHLIYQDNIL